MLSINEVVGGRRVSCVMSMRALSTSSLGAGHFLTLYRYGHYRPAKKRWWPLFALLGALWGLRAGVARTPQQSDGTQPTQNLSYNRSSDQVGW